MAVRQRDQAAAAEPADAVKGSAGRVLQAACGADIGKIDAVRRRGDTDRDDVGVFPLGCPVTILVSAQLGVLEQLSVVEALSCFST